MKRILALLAFGSLAHSDIIPGSLPILTPFGLGQVSVAYNLALTTQTIQPGSEFVILDVVGFDHWDTPSVSYSLSVEPVTQGITHFDDPTKQNLRFTFMDLEALTGPQVLEPLSGFLFHESPELISRSLNFATHAYQIEEEIAPMTHRISRHLAAIPEPSTSMAGIFLAGLAWLNRRRQ